jgi:N6-adenosine-specific RNA methylase IME4
MVSADTMGILARVKLMTSDSTGRVQQAAGFARAGPATCQGSQWGYAMGLRSRHSRKPDEEYEHIEAMFSGPYIESLFARKLRSGWTSWGSQIRTMKEESRCRPTFAC